jgi:WD40 repeat protein
MCQVRLPLVALACLVATLAVSPTSASGTVQAANRIPGNGAIATTFGLLAAGTREPVRPPWTPQQGVNPVFSPSGSAVAWTTSETAPSAPPGQPAAETRLTRVWVLDLEKNAPARDVASLPGFSSRLTWSPDGRQVALRTGSESGRVSLLTVDGSVPPRTLIEDPRGVIVDVAWSPSGQHLALTRRIDRSDLFLFNLSTGSLRQLTHTCAWPERIDEPGSTDCRNQYQGPRWAWSPDGRALYGTRSNRRGFDLIRVSAATGKVRVLRHDDTLAFTSVVASPDGRRLAFGQRADPSGLATTTATMPVDGGRITVLQNRWQDVISWQACPGGRCVPIGAPRLVATLDVTVEAGPRNVRVQGLVSPGSEANRGELVSTLHVLRHGRWQKHDSQIGPMEGNGGAFTRRLDRPSSGRDCRVTTRFLGSSWVGPAHQVTDLAC